MSSSETAATAAAGPESRPRAVCATAAAGIPVRPTWTPGGWALAMFLVGGSAMSMVGYDAMLWRLHAPHISLITLLAILLAATCSSVAGFAFSALCGAILFHTVETPVMAVEIMLLCSITIQGVSVLALRNAIDWRSLLEFLAGGAIGLPIGVYALLHLPKGAFGSAFGVILVAYGVFMALRPPLRLRAEAGAWNVVIGAVGGVTGGLAAFPGAVVTIWCGLKGWNKVRQRGVYQPFILVMQVLTVAAIAVAPRAPGIPSSLDAGIVEYIPAALVGTLLGLWFFRRMTDRHFALAVNLLLIAAGAAMVL